MAGPGQPGGAGIGLRAPHLAEIFSAEQQVPWLEVLADNYLVGGGFERDHLRAIAERYPLSLHCIGMNLGGTDPLDIDYLKRIKALSAELGAHWVSDHLCFCQVQGDFLPDLLPLPYSQEALHHISERLAATQDILGEQILLENASAYVSYRESTMDEVEFLAELAQRADCKLLLDVNNLYVNHINLGTDLDDLLGRLPIERIAEIHLAGYEAVEDLAGSGFLLDSHSRPVSDPVWALFEQLISRLYDVPVLVEWDNDIPPLSTVLSEAHKAQRLIDRHRRQATGQRAAP